MEIKPKEKSSDSVTFEKHGSERQHDGSHLFCGGGCCCCCCLHSVGGLVGAVTAVVNNKSQSEISVSTVYWICLAVLAGGIVIFESSASGSIGAIGAILLFLPLAQLLASLLTLIWMKISGPDFPDQKASLRILGRITLRSFLGALIGVAAMFGCLLLISS